jgi:hypothetical protein
MLFLGHVTEGGNANNLEEMILYTLRYRDGLDEDHIAKRLISFKEDGTFVFQGKTHGVTKLRLLLT